MNNARSLFFRRNFLRRQPKIEQSTAITHCSSLSATARNIWSCVAGLLIGAFTISAHAEEISREARIQAAVAYNIAKFVDWRSDGKNTNRTSLRICTASHSPVDNAVHEIFDGKTIGSLPTNVLQIDSFEHAERHRCDIVFLSIQGEALARAATELSRQGILTICHTPAIEWNGCIAQIFTQDNKARIAFDLTASRRAGLTVSSELLELSVVRQSD